MTITVTPEIVSTSLDSLTPYENNPRINHDAVAGIVASIKEFGFLVPIVVDKNGVLITGHTRFLAAKSLGMEVVPVIRATNLTPAQVNAFRIADNRLSENSKWDENKLSDELRVIQDMGFDLGFTGFSAEELDCLCGQIEASCLADLDYANVCGAVVEKEVVARDSITISVGTYKFFVKMKDYLNWEADLRQDYPKKSELVKELARRLGFMGSPAALDLQSIAPDTLPLEVDNG